MNLFAVSLLFTLEVQAVDAPEPTRELAIYLLSAASREDAIAKGQLIGNARELSYENSEGETVHDVFQAVVEVQKLHDVAIFDGMEVSSWLYQGDRLVLGDGWIAAEPVVKS